MRVYICVAVMDCLTLLYILARPSAVIDRFDGILWLDEVESKAVVLANDTAIFIAPVTGDASHR